MNKKNILIFSSIFLVLLLIAGGTYAYWIWNSEESKNVVFNSIGDVDDYIVYDEGLSYFVGDFQPYDSFCQSISTTVSFYKTKKAYQTDLTATIYMDINSIGDNIAATDAVYWVVTSGGNNISCADGLSSSSVISYGTFNGVQSDSTISLLSNILVGTEEREFTIWIWIDSSSDSDLSVLTGETVDTNIWTQIDMYSNNSEVPRLDYGMIPVTVSKNGDVRTMNPTTDRDFWYNYSQKQWANAVLVTQESRNMYINTSGVIVDPDDILAYYVWIPRYKYKIPGIKCSTLDNPTPENNPECYAPYTVSDEDRTEMINYIDAVINCESSDVEYSTMYADALIQSGVSFEMVTLPQVVAIYNAGVTVCDSNPFTPKASGLSYESGSFNGNNTLFVESTVDVVFEGASLPMTLGDAKLSYRTHSAFWWDNDSDEVVDDGELVAGIWVGKFESTGTGDNPTILPNVSALRNQNQATQFATSLKFADSSNAYGLNDTIVDSHMMKSPEWGAVAYLSYSLYGIQSNVRVNNNTDYITGCGALEDYASGVAACEIAYGSGVTSYPQSTTGNITGVFDMSGGSWEIMMSMHEGTIETGGFTTIPDNKYYNEYSNLNMDTACNGDKCYGHALFEVIGWYDAWSMIPNEKYPWSVRGGKSTAEETMLTGNTIFMADMVRYPMMIGSNNSSWRSVIVLGYDS